MLPYGGSFFLSVENMKKNSIKENENLYPHLVEQFHPTLNGENTIENVTIKSAKMITWVCQKGHVWESRPYNMIKNTTCPICSGKIITKEKSLGGQHPDLVKSFSDKNKESIFEVGEKSSKYFIWKCEKGHEYKARPVVKVQSADKHWCPECNGVKTDLKCPKCDQVFPNSIGLATHMRLVHNSGIKKCKIKGCNNTIKTFSKTCEEHSKISRKITEKQYKKKINHILKKSNVTIKTAYEDYVSNMQLLDCECDKGHQFKRTYASSYNNSAVCPVCHPKGTSLLEDDLENYIKSLGFETERNTREPIKPLEIDVFIPSQMVGVELNGLYWHSEAWKDKNYHLSKLRAAEDKGIRLINIFEDEWEQNSDICKSMIAHILGKTENKIFARKCKVVDISIDERREFFNANHIMGDVGSKASFALQYNDEIVSVVSVRKPHTYKDTLEIARYATKINHHVVGGFSKLLEKVKEYCKQQNYSQLITYAHNTHATGDVYLKSGFEYVKDTGVDYWYTRGNQRFGRMKYRAQKGKTEKQVAEENGVLKIYGCGSKLFKMDISQGK